MDDNAGGVQGRNGGGERPPQLRLYPGGPMVVRGAVELIGADGQVFTPRRRVVALCRCGRSALLPYCDGNHKQVSSFTADRELRSRTDESDR